MWKHALTGLMTMSILAAPLPVAAQGETKPPAQTSAKKETRTERARAGLAAARQRQKQCGAEWREAKAAGKIAAGMKWPKYWSECNKRLKAKSG